MYMGRSMSQTTGVEKLKEKLLGSRRPEDTRLPSFVSSAVAIEKSKVQGFPVYRLIPERARGNIFYLYQSDFSMPIRKKEWEYILELCCMTRMAVTVPLYPIAPEHDCEEAFDFLIPAYQGYCKRREEGPLIFVGSGAGAGLALSMMLQIWKEGLADPDKVVLLSPVMDTEFFDPELEKTLKRDGRELEFQLVKEFLNAYWVKNYAGRMEFTAPIYEDLHDICKDILVASGTKDPGNGYARYFSAKVQDTGNPLKFFEFRGVGRNFYFHSSKKETKHLMKVLHDFLLDTDDAIMYQYMQEVRQRADYSKWFPEIFRDEHAVRYISGHPKRAVGERKGMSIYNLVNASVLAAFDSAVELFLKEYPNGTVVYVGCSLDTMLERVDNGRVLWYNLDSPGRMAIRTMYTGLGKRERRIERSVDDFAWISELSAEMDQGLLFVVRDIFSYMSKKEMREFLNLLYKNFQGCNVLFDMPTARARVMSNMKGRNRGAEYRKRQLSMRDPRRELEVMSPIYSIVSERSVLENVHPRKSWKLGLKMSLMSNRRRNAWKIVHVRLGYEKYKTFD